MGFVDVAKKFAKRIRTKTELAVGYYGAKARQVSLRVRGHDLFEWGTEGDDLVRPAHAALEGQVFSTREGHPTEGFPGTKPRCRCRPKRVR